ncbi:hypothetical protein TcWFU_005839 [Taenia crassiceps]|uniref:Uncharacterized protein n=1 Tax=Taenia crassiceps TaxID=6207 RepID=A0ABR4Q2X5_9CEST
MPLRCVDCRRHLPPPPTNSQSECSHLYVDAKSNEGHVHNLYLFIHAIGARSDHNRRRERGLMRSHTCKAAVPGDGEADADAVGDADADGKASALTFPVTKTKPNGSAQAISTTWRAASQTLRLPRLENGTWRSENSWCRLLWTIATQSKETATSAQLRGCRHLAHCDNLFRPPLHPSLQLRLVRLDKGALHCVSVLYCTVLCTHLVFTRCITRNAVFLQGFAKHSTPLVVTRSESRTAAFVTFSPAPAPALLFGTTFSSQLLGAVELKSSLCAQCCNKGEAYNKRTPGKHLHHYEVTSGVTSGV